MAIRNPQALSALLTPGQRFLTDEVDMRRNKRAQAVDKMAAAYILQGALDALAKPPSAT
jgi:hypothetical protein